MLAYLPALDGIRGVLLLTVLAYHFGLIDTGLLSMSVFFTLSGYLITAILIGALRTHGTIDLRAFWLRRARRLLPALYAMLAVVLATTAAVRPDQLRVRARQTVAAVLYVANWHTIARGETYFRRFAGPEPLDHLWSLAVEEQFYFAWPLLVLLVVALSGRPRTVVPRLVGLGVALVLASTVASALLYRTHALDTTRVHVGTDTRAAAILVGAVTALLLHPTELEGLGQRARLALDGLGMIAAAVLARVIATTNEHDSFLYRGGELVTAIAAAVLVLSAAHPDTVMRKVLAREPFRWLGERSYAIYLWHMPLAVFGPTTGVMARPLPRAAILTAATIGLGALSFAALEDPVRRRGLVATFTGGDRRERLRRWIAVAGFLVAAHALLVLGARHEKAHAAAPDLAQLGVELSPPVTTASVTPSEAAAPAHVEGPTLTACSSVVHVGDSNSLGMISAKYLPRVEDRLAGRYHAVGVQTVVLEVSGGRSIVEKVNDQPSAYEVVVAHVGFQGCWVFALGAADAATVKGHEGALAQRIDWMVDGTHGGQVLFATVKTLLTTGSFQDAHMQRWNQVVKAACARHPKLRVFDWAAEVQDSWFLPDKVHPNEVGSKERAVRLARALAKAFPRDAPPSPSCVVPSGL